MPGQSFGQWPGEESGISNTPGQTRELAIKGFKDLIGQAESGKAAIILASTPLQEDEGQRSTHFALELSSRGFAVLHVYWRWDEESWAAQDWVTEGIIQAPIDQFVDRPMDWMQAFDGFAERLLLVEFPYPDFFRALALANASGWITIYDVVDDWKAFQEVGQAGWYDEEFEAHLIRNADLILAVNAKLRDKIRGIADVEVKIIPNAVKRGIEIVEHERVLERGAVTLGYFGYLSRAWFDWGLIREVGLQQPEWRIYLIGYGEDVARQSIPANVAYLGKQPQGALGAFAANWDVAIVPFKSGAVAVGADPIKTYEYLAMGLPVVVTGVQPPIGAEGWVFEAEGVDDFVYKVYKAATTTAQTMEKGRVFAAENTWDSRVDLLLKHIAGDGQRLQEKRYMTQVHR
jgi:glycosyltransferase involved in cell wall biosynthesis